MVETAGKTEAEINEAFGRIKAELPYKPMTISDTEKKQ